MQGSNGEADTDNRHGYGDAGREEGGMNRESNRETCTLPYVKQRASKSLLYDSGNSNWGPVTT